MKSSVSHYLDYRNIPIPEEMLTIKIPSWEATAQPLVDYAKKQYIHRFGKLEGDFNDEKVQALALPGIETLNDLKRYGMSTYQKNQENYQYFSQVLPFILKFYQVSSNTIIDRDEKEAYLAEYLEHMKFYAQAEKLRLEKYVEDKLHIKLDGPVEDLIRQRGLEDFVFKIIAHDMFTKSGHVLNEDSYEEFIMQNVLNNGLDEINLREEIPYHRYLKMIPEMQLSQDMFNYFVSKMHVKIDPESTIRLFNK